MIRSLRLFIASALFAVPALAGSVQNPANVDTPITAGHLVIGHGKQGLADGGAPAPSATTDTTNASNISSGMLSGARLPTPAPSTLGGVMSFAATSHCFLISISTSGAFSCAQPAATDISGLAASATTDTTNASNISSGTLSASRLPALSGDITTSAGTGVTVLKAVGTSGTYTKVTTDSNGRVTSGASLTSSDVTTALGFTPLSSSSWGAPGPIGITTPNSVSATTLAASGQITSTVPTGTAPISVSSTTVVPNLDVSLLNGYGTGTSGSVYCLLSASCTWSGSEVFSGNAGFESGAFFAGAVFGNYSTGNTTVHITRANSFTDALNFDTSGVTRWSLSVSGTEPGNNTQSYLTLGSFLDSGAYAGAIMQATRTSGAQNNGNPVFTSMAPANFNVSAAVNQGGVSGNQYIWTDVQPTSTLTNPISTTSGSSSVVIAWTGHALTTSTYINVVATSAVGGVTLNGWYPITATTTNTLTINAGANASATAGPGGGSVAVTPIIATQGSRLNFKATSNSPGAHIGHTQLLAVQPAQYTTLASGLTQPYYQGQWNVCNSPNDITGANAWSLTCQEWDIVNRGGDKGFREDVYLPTNLTSGFFMIPEALTFGTTDGGQGFNADVGFVVGHSGSANSSGYQVRWYDGYNVAPNALTGVLQDTVTGHGGVGFGFYGAYSPAVSNPFTTATGTNTITVNVVQAADMLGQGNGNSVFIPGTYNLNGVTFGSASYVMSNVNVSAGTFQIAGLGTASASGAGGGSNQWVSFATSVPYAYGDLEGEWAHGLYLANAHFDDGFPVYMPASSGLGWADGLSLKSDGAGNAVLNNPLKLPGAASTTTAQAGTLCLGTGGLVTYDPTLSCTSSSLRFKEKWRDVVSRDALKLVRRLRPGTFKYKPFVGVDKAEQYGFAAEQVAKVDPKLVGFEPDGVTPRGVRYQEMTAVLAGAIQQLDKQEHRQQIEIYLLTAWCLILSGFAVYLVFGRRGISAHAPTFGAREPPRRI